MQPRPWLDQQADKETSCKLVSDIAVFFFFLQNIIIPAHSLASNSRKNTDATFGIFQKFFNCTNKPEPTTRRCRYKEATSAHQLQLPHSRESSWQPQKRDKKSRLFFSYIWTWFSFYSRHNFWPSLDFWWSKMSIGRPENTTLLHMGDFQPHLRHRRVVRRSGVRGQHLQTESDEDLQKRRDPAAAGAAHLCQQQAALKA